MSGNFEVGFGKNKTAPGYCSPWVMASHQRPPSLLREQIGHRMETCGKVAEGTKPLNLTSMSLKIQMCLNGKFDGGRGSAEKMLGKL